MEILMVVGKIILLVVFIVIGEIVDRVFLESKTFKGKAISFSLVMIITAIIAYLMFS
jgi:hypothetical protein